MPTNPPDPTGYPGPPPKDPPKPCAQTPLEVEFANAEDGNALAQLPEPQEDDL